MKLEDFWGKNVNVTCKDGRVFKAYHVEGFTPHYENYDPVDNTPDEDSIILFPINGPKDGIGLFASEIESIDVVS